MSAPRRPCSSSTKIVEGITVTYFFSRRRTNLFWCILSSHGTGSSFPVNSKLSHTQSWYGILIRLDLHATVRRIKLHRKRRTVCTSSCRQIRNQAVLLQISSLQFVRAREDLRWCQNKSTPCRSESNGIAEHAVSRVSEGIAVWLCRKVVDCFCFFAKHTRQTGRQKGHRMKNRFGTPLDGPLVPSNFYDGRTCRLHHFG